MQTQPNRPDPHRHQRGAALIGIAGLVALGLGAAAVHGFGNGTQPDAVAEWNRIGMDVGAALERGTSEQRELTMMHLAIHDALQSIRPVYASYVAPVRMHPDALPEAAIATAAHDVLVATVPMKRTALDATYNDALARLPAGAPREEGVRAGHEAASAILARRASDRSDAADIAWDGKPGIGQWETTPPNHFKALLPGWRFVTPFAMRSADQFLPPPPPALDSAEYARQYAVVKGLGGETTTSRTDEQSEIARFWAGNVNDAWNEIARKTMAANAPRRRDELALWRNARTFALLNVAMADGFVSGWHAKYHYHYWRPVTAIPRGDADGNPATVPDAGWTSYLPTPEHPEYPSTHSVLSGAAATTLKCAMGIDRTNVDITSHGHYAGITRRIEGFDDTAKEVAISRVYAGAHFPYANDMGLVQGRRIGALVCGELLQPLARG